MADKYVNFSDSKGDSILIKALEQGDGTYSLAMGDRDKATDNNLTNIRLEWYEHTDKA